MGHCHYASNLRHFHHKPAPQCCGRTSVLCIPAGCPQVCAPVATEYTRNPDVAIRVWQEGTTFYQEYSASIFEVKVCWLQGVTAQNNPVLQKWNTVHAEGGRGLPPKRCYPSTKFHGVTPRHSLPCEPQTSKLAYRSQNDASLPQHCTLSVSTLRKSDAPLTLRRLMSYIYGAPILDVSRSHTTTQHSR